MKNIDITLTNDDGEEEVFTLPARNEVCPDCEGEGFTLIEGIRHHCYSGEEFMEEFPEYEDREQYFKRGGVYDEQCRTCKGANVVTVVDREKCNPEQLEVLKRYDAQEEEHWEYEAMCASERRMGA